MKRVIIESPFGSHLEKVVQENLRFLRACLHDALVNHDEAPFASHGLYTQLGVLDDRDQSERMHGIHAGFEWRSCAEATVVYTNRGISSGMRYGIDDATRIGQQIIYRVLEGWVDTCGC